MDSTQCLMCSYCGHEIWFGDADRAQAMVRATEHSSVCAANPLVQRIRDLEAQLAARGAPVAPCTVPPADGQGQAVARALVAATGCTPIQERPCSCGQCSGRTLTPRAISQIQLLAIQARASATPGVARLEFANEHGMGSTVVAVLPEAQWLQLLSAAGGGS